MRWDAEEDLSRVLGDIAAHKLVSTATVCSTGTETPPKPSPDPGPSTGRKKTRCWLNRKRCTPFSRKWSELHGRVERLAQKIEQLSVQTMKLLRLAKIFYVTLRFGLEEFFLGHERFRWLRRWSWSRCSGARSTNRARSGCARRWRRSGRFSSSSARCCPPGAT